MWNKLDCHSFCLRTCFVAHVVYVSAGYISKALACTVGRERAVMLVGRNGSLCDCDQAGTGMGMPPGLTSRLKGELSDVEVRVAVHLRQENPKR
jgi:hypothetical protein